jgi:translocation and assembly module TamB
MKWRKITAGVAGGMAFFILLALFTAFLIQQNTFLHRYLLAKTIQIAEKSSGSEITIRDYAIGWLPLHVTLEGVVVLGTRKDLARPLANLPRIEIGLGWNALLHKRADLTELAFDRPAINLVIDQAGRSNLPFRPASPSAPSRNKLQLSVEHAAVRNGELRFNDAPRKIDANLADFRLEASHDAAIDGYSGTLGYSKGQITIDGHTPVHHEAKISFAATSAGITFERIHISTPLSQLNAKGALRGYLSPVVEGQYQAVLAAADLHEQLPTVPLSGGEIELAGSLFYRAGGGPPLNALRLRGHLSSQALAATLSRAELNFRSLAGEYALQDGSLHVSGVQAETLGGILRAEFTGEHLTATPRYQLAVSADSVSLEQAKQVSGAMSVPLRGTAHVRASAHWTSSVQNLMARADAGIAASINAGLNPLASTNPVWLPMNGDLHLAYDAPHARLTITNTSFSSSETTITAAGTVSEHSALDLRAHTSDLQEVDRLFVAGQTILRAAGKTSAAASQPLELHGRASLEAQVQGRLQDPRIAGRVQVDGLEIRKARWPHIQTDFEASASSLGLRNGQAQTANHGRVNFALATNLQHGVYTANNPTTLQVQAVQVPLADLADLSGTSPAISGMLSGNLSLRGTINDPVGEGSLQLRDASLWGETVRGVTGQLRGANKTISASFSITAPAGNISGTGEFGAADGHYQISISHSVLHLDQIHYLSSHGYAIAGTLGIDAQGGGTLTAPAVDVTLAAEKLSFRDAPLGSVSAQLHVAHQQVNFALDSTISGGQIRANGNAALAVPYPMHGSFEVRSLEFGPLLATYLPGGRRELQGSAEVRGQIDGPLARLDEVKASAEFSTLKLGHQDLQLASAGPVRLNYTNDVLTISQSELRGTDTDFKFQGKIPLRGSAPLDISTNGLIDLRLLTALGSNTESSGTVKIDVTAKGALKQPQLRGSIEVAKLSLATDIAPIGVDNVNARIALANNRLTIENFSGQMSGGSFSVGGFASYSPVSFSLGINGKSIRVRYPEGTRAQLDTNLTLTGTASSSVLNGRVTIDALSFTPDFDLANFIGQLSSSAPSVPAKWEQKMRVDIAVASSQVLALSSSKLSLQGSADLRVTGTLANPVVLGRTILSGGELFFMGHRYQVQSGTVVFSNPLRTEPTLNLYVTTVVEQYNITLNVLGPLDRLRTNYTADPALPPVDIIQLLAFGKTTAESAATATPAALGAESAIANGLTSQVSSRIEKLAGISQLQIDPSLAGINSNPGARLAIQQRLTSSILFTFATDLTDTQNAVVQVKYQTRGRLSVSVTRDEYGSFAIEGKIRKKF